MKKIFELVQLIIQILPLKIQQRTPLSMDKLALLSMDKHK